MNAVLVLIVALVVLALGYKFYGTWLEKSWGVVPNQKTPSHEMEDGVDYVPAKALLIYRRCRPYQRTYSGSCIRLGSCSSVGPCRWYFLRWRS